MVPPGLAFLYMGERAWAANAEAKMPRFYFDAKRTKDSLDKGQNPWTPAMSIYYAMDRAFEMMRAEGYILKRASAQPASENTQQKGSPT